jgi:hypothetical protein
LLPWRCWSAISCTRSLVETSFMMIPLLYKTAVDDYS